MLPLVTAGDNACMPSFLLAVDVQLYAHAVETIRLSGLDSRGGRGPPTSPTSPVPKSQRAFAALCLSPCGHRQNPITVCLSHYCHRQCLSGTRVHPVHPSTHQLHSVTPPLHGRYSQVHSDTFPLHTDTLHSNTLLLYSVTLCCTPFISRHTQVHSRDTSVMTQALSVIVVEPRGKCTSSGFTPLDGSFPKNFRTVSTTFGVRVIPPTSNTWPMALLRRVAQG